MKKGVKVDAGLIAPSPNRDSDEGAWPTGVARDRRILSDWNDPVLRVANGDKIRLIDLSRIPLPANGPDGPFSESFTLGKFPHWVDVARAQFCNVLSAGTGHDALGKAVNSLNHTSRFFAWCVKNRIYKLADVTLDDMRRLALELQPKGWLSALNTEAELRELVRRCEDDKALLLQVASSHDGATCSISSERLSSYLGYVVTSREYPMFLRKEIAGLMQKVTVGAERRSDDMQPWSEASFKNCFGALNGLCILPATLDRLSFEPFANARLHARLANGIPDGRTANLTVEDAAKLLAESLEWLYNKADAVIELVAFWRETLVGTASEYKGEANVSTRVNAAIRERYAELKSRVDFPYEVASFTTATGESISLLVKNLLTAAFVLIAITQARRKNEVVGEGSRPWGIYAACLEKIDPDIDAYALDIYIEKTWNAWMKMPASALTVHAVDVLTRLRAAALPGEEVGTSDQDRRAQKLFSFPGSAALLGDASAMFGFSFDEHSGELYSLAGVADSERKTHMFRRFFALVYFYRWEHPKLQALSEFLAHFDLETTRVYIADPAMRDKADRIEALHRHRADCFPEQEMSEAQRHYADAQLDAMLTSDGAGGPMTRRVHRWIQRIWRHVEFPDRDPATLKSEIRKQFKSRGYAPTPMSHGVCWAEESGARVGLRGRCSKEGTIRRELAGVDICGACVFHSTSSSFLLNVEQDAKRLDEQAALATDPREAQVLRATASCSRELVELELSLIQRQRCPLTKPPGKKVPE